MKKKYYVQPTNDYVFRRIFGYPGNEKITEDIISEIIGEKLEIERLAQIEKFITKWKVREEENHNIVLTGKLEIHIIELPKIKKAIKGKYRGKLLSWMRFIQNPESLEEKEMNKYEKIQEAGEILDYINKDEHEKWLAEQRMIYKMDQNAVEEFGYHKGKKRERKRKKLELLKICLGKI